MYLLLIIFTLIIGAIFCYIFIREFKSTGSVLEKKISELNHELVISGEKVNQARLHTEETVNNLQKIKTKNYENEKAEILKSKYNNVNVYESNIEEYSSDKSNHLDNNTGEDFVPVRIEPLPEENKNNVVCEENICYIDKHKESIRNEKYAENRKEEYVTITETDKINGFAGNQEIIEQWNDKQEVGKHESDNQEIEDQNIVKQEYIQEYKEQKPDSSLSELTKINTEEKQKQSNPLKLNSIESYTLHQLKQIAKDNGYTNLSKKIKKTEVYKLLTNIDSK